MPNPIINTSHLWADIAELAKAALDSKRAVYDGLWHEISDLAGLHQETMEAAADRLTDETRELCSLEQRVKEEIRRQLVQMVGNCSCLLDNCNAIIDEHNRKIAKREKNRQAQARRRSRQPVSGGGELPAGMSLFPPVPQPGTYTGMYVPMADGESRLEIDQFPDSMWDVNSDGGIFWAGAPTPFTRSLVAYYDSSGDGVTPAGELTINVTTEIPDDSYNQIITELGFAPQGVTTLTQEQAYYSAAQVYGQVVVDNLYDQRGIHTYARRPNDVPRMRDINQPLANPSVLSSMPAIQPIVERLADNVQPAVNWRGRLTEFARDARTDIGIQSLVDKAIRLGLVPPEQRGEAENWLSAPGNLPARAGGNPGNGLPTIEPRVEPTSNRSVVPDGRHVVGMSDCPWWINAVMHVAGLDCASNFCDVINSMCRAIGIPENTIPPCKSLDEFIAHVTHRGR